MDLAILILTAASLAVGVAILLRMGLPVPEDMTLDRIIEYLREKDIDDAEADLRAIMLDLGIPSLAVSLPIEDAEFEDDEPEIYAPQIAEPEEMKVSPEDVEKIFKLYAETPVGRGKLAQSFIRPLENALQAPEEPSNQATMRRILGASKLIQEKGGKEFKFSEKVERLLDRANSSLKKDLAPVDPETPSDPV